MMLQLQLQNKLPIPGKTNLDWYLFDQMMSDYHNQPMLEVGVGRGGSAVAMSEHTNKLELIDSWDQTWPKKPVEDIFDKYEIPVKFIDGKSGSLDVLASIKSQYKFIHLDANKSYEGTLDDLEKYNSFCDGVICVDDYLQSMWPEVTRATDDFVKNSEWNRILIGNHQVFLSRKKQTPASRKITLKFPVVLRNDEVHLTYGKLPKEVDRFMGVTNKKVYTWHTTAWK